MEQIIKIGARGSPLSITQTKWLRAELAKAHDVAPHEIETIFPISPITTQGDKIQDRALLEAGGKGLFTKELDEALVDGRIDCAVHSMKDVPTILPDGIVLLGCPLREDRRDALITKDGIAFDELPNGASLGTASLRRSSQFLALRPDLKISLLRGNVGTRLKKITDGEFDATILAIAGLKRLGMADVPHSLIDPKIMPPAIGQGALAITARFGDERIINAFKAIEDINTTLEITAERAFLRALDGSCRTPIAALCEIKDEILYFKGEYFCPNTNIKINKKDAVKNPDMQSAAQIGNKLAQNILDEISK